MRIIARIAALLTIICFLVDSGHAQGARCGLEKFQCHDGECIAGELLCDGKADCRDQSDETESECTRPEILCPDYAFRCKYGACVNGDAICNGVKDCVDNSDEALPQCTSSSGNQTGRPSSCNRDQFTCDNGQCIYSIAVCDGRVDCADGSDEVVGICGSFSCSPTVFRCAYGACIDGNLRCNGVINCADGSDEDPKLCNSPTWPFSPGTTTTTSTTPRSRTTSTTSIPASTAGCEVPSQPPNGYWKLHQLHCPNREYCDLQAGITKLPSGSYLVYSCNPGYKIRGTSDVICSLGGNWRTIPVCTEIRCKGLSTASVSARCEYNAGWVPCESPVLPGTKAELKCRKSYRPEINLPLSRGNNVICNTDGLWQPDPLRCVPECGVLPGDFTPLIVNATKLGNITEFPWHASMYRDDPGSSKIFICGATIVRENLLVTAAHCVYDSITRRAINSSRLHIMTGNIYRDYNYPLHNNEIVKTAEVKNIYMECHYEDQAGNFASDIALLELVMPFVLSASLVPACLDFSSGGDQQVLDTNVRGKVAGFGRTAYAASSAVLQSLEVPYVPYSLCKSASKDQRTQHLITPDKFCAGYTNGSSVCEGDSGGGLVFLSDNRWFLRGIVSVSLGTIKHGADKICNYNLYSIYTRVSSYVEWIDDMILSIEENRPYRLCPDRL